MRRVWVFAVYAAAALCIRGQGLTPRQIFYGEGLREANTPPAPKKKAAPTPKHHPTQAPANAAAVPPANPGAGPLVLKYAILKRSPDGEYREVPDDATFASGDRIRLIVESNDSGYLYVVSRGASQRWNPLYFAPKGDSSNRIEPGRRYTIPPGDDVISFVAPPGAEKLFVVLSREPQADVEKLIYSLDRSKEDSRPANAQVSEQDDLVQRLRRANSRDLIIERVDDTRKKAADAAPERPPEKAVYVANPKAGPNGQVVADIELKHR